eukprot:gene53151-43736_t
MGRVCNPSVCGSLGTGGSWACPGCGAASGGRPATEGGTAGRHIATRLR